MSAEASGEAIRGRTDHHSRCRRPVRARGHRSRGQRLGSGRARQDHGLREIDWLRTVDTCRSPRAANGPFGATVQHGFFTLGLSTGLLDQVFSVTDVGVVLITGSTASGFPRLCERAKRVRMHVALNEATKLGEGSRWCTGFATKWRVRTNRAPSRSWSFGTTTRC